MSKVLSYSLFTDFDISLFKSGKHYRLFEKFGAHITTLDGVSGTYFSVWAPSAKSVSVIGDFNYWDAAASPLKLGGIPVVFGRVLSPMLVKVQYINTAFTVM